MKRSKRSIKLSNIESVDSQEFVCGRVISRPKCYFLFVLALIRRVISSAWEHYLGGVGGREDSIQ